MYSPYVGIVLAAAATAAVAAIVATKVVAYAEGIAIAAIGVRHNISRYGALIASASDDLGGRCVDSGADNRILISLRSAQTECVILALECVNLGLHHEVHNAAIVGVLIVDNVAGCTVNGVAQVAEACSEVVIYAVNGALSLAAILLSYKLFISYFSRFPREFRLYLHPPISVGVGRSCWDYWYPSSPISR